MCETQHRDTVAKISTDFLQRYGQYNASSKLRLVRETLERLSALFGAQVESRLIPQPERVGEVSGVPGKVVAAIEVVYRRFDEGNAKMFRLSLLLCSDSAWTFRMTTRELTPVDGYVEDIEAGTGVLALLKDACEENVQVLLSEATKPSHAV